MIKIKIYFIRDEKPKQGSSMKTGPPLTETCESADKAIPLLLDIISTIFPPYLNEPSLETWSICSLD